MIMSVPRNNYNRVVIPRTVRTWKPKKTHGRKKKEERRRRKKKKKEEEERRRRRRKKK